MNLKDSYLHGSNTLGALLKNLGVDKDNITLTYATPDKDDNTKDATGTVKIPTWNLDTTGNAATATKATYNSDGVKISSTPLVIGTQTAATYALTGSLVGTGIKELKTGTTINYYMPATPAGTLRSFTINGGAKTGCGLVLELDDPELENDGSVKVNNGNVVYKKSEETPVYYNATTTLTTHYSWGSVIRMTYFGPNTILNANGTSATVAKRDKACWVCDCNYTDGNTYDRIHLTNGCGISHTEYTKDANGKDTTTKAYNNGIVRYSLVMRCSDGTFNSVTTNDNAPASYTKTAPTTVKFDLSNVYYYAANGVVASGSKFSAYLYESFGAVITTGYSLNVGNSNTKGNAGEGKMTPTKPLFLVGTIDSEGWFHLRLTKDGSTITADCWSNTLPTTEDGLVYVYVGMVYTDTYGYRNTLETVNPAYWFKNGHIERYIGLHYVSSGKGYINGAEITTISGNAATADIATKLGTNTIGNSARPIYLNAGVPTLITVSAGSADYEREVVVIGGTDNNTFYKVTGVTANYANKTLTANKFIGALNGNADTVTNGVYTTGNLTIGGIKTFSSTIAGSINGNAATATRLTNWQNLSFMVQDNGGRDALVLIADCTDMMDGATHINAVYGIIGFMWGLRNGNCTGSGTLQIMCYTAYQRTSSCQFFKTDNSTSHALKPQLIKYNNRYYCALLKKGSGRTHYFQGYAANLLETRIHLYKNTEGKWFSEGTYTNEVTVEVITDTQKWNFNGDINGQALTVAHSLTAGTKTFNGSADITLSLSDFGTQAVSSNDISNWNSVYNWYSVATDHDTDATISKWGEISSFLAGITDTQTLNGILDGYVTIGTTQTIEGSKTFSNPIIASSGVVGNATTADLLKNARTFTLTGNVTSSAVSFNGGSNVSIATTIANNAVTNAMLAGSIANDKLVNYKITLAGTDISLGGSVSTLAGCLTLGTTDTYNAQLHIVRKGSTNLASIGFYNGTDGTTFLGTIGMNTANGKLIRYKTDNSTHYDILDSSDTSVSATTSDAKWGDSITVKINNTEKTLTIPAKPTYSASDVGLGNVTNDALIAKSIFTAVGLIVTSSASATPVVINANTTTTAKYLRSKASTAGTAIQPTWELISYNDLTDKPSIPTVTNFKWANLSVASAVAYNTAPEFGSVKIGNGSATATATTHCTLVYDATTKCLKFNFG